MKIQFNDVSIKAKLYKKKVLDKVSDVLDRGIFLNGLENKKIIDRLVKYLGVKGVVLTASGHDSLFFAIKSLHLASRDEVIFPVNAYPTAFPLAQSGATLVPVDVDKNGLIDVTMLTKKITLLTKAIVVVHMYGLVCDMEAIQEVIKGKGIALIEDCAQSFGSLYKDRPVGTFGDISCFSFYPTKNLSGLGYGGALFTKNAEIYQYAKQAVSYGAKFKYRSEFISGHSRIPEIQAGILNTYYKSIRKEQIARKKVLNTYQNLLSRAKLDSKVRVLYHESNSHPNLHLLVAEVKDRNKLKKYIEEKKIPTAIHYPYPIHLVKAFSHLKYKDTDFPQAEHLSKSMVSLPFHPYITTSQIKYIVQSIKNFYA